jgi:hypothetical protein
MGVTPLGSRFLVLASLFVFRFEPNLNANLHLNLEREPEREHEPRTENPEA